MNALPDYPALVHVAIRRFSSGEPVQAAARWTWDRADKASRDKVDAWIVAAKHPLGFEPGTAEARFLRLVQEIYEENDK